MIAAYILLMIFLALLAIFFGIATTEETKSVATNNEENLESYNDANNTTDKFGIKKMYPTTQGGREWFIDMINPKSDGIFSITSNHNITKQRDDSWRIDVPMVRMNIDTPPGAKPWKNVEITGYVKVVSKSSPNNNTDLDWSARGGRQNGSIPCEGTALHGGLHIDGSVGWKKEIWQVGGYTAERAKAKVLTDSILGRWIGWKVVMYNINNDTAVKMESYIDNKNTNYWVKVTDVIDNGGWFANTPDNIFYSANCGKPKDYIVTNGGNIVTFRSDNLVWDFKDLSVREIIPGEKIYNQP
jgi:hypothetical protein